MNFSFFHTVKIKVYQYVFIIMSVFVFLTKNYQNIYISSYIILAECLKLFLTLSKSLTSITIFSWLKLFQWFSKENFNPLKTYNIEYKISLNLLFPSSTFSLYQVLCFPVDLSSQYSNNR